MSDAGDSAEPQQPSSKQSALSIRRHESTPSSRAEQGLASTKPVSATLKRYSSDSVLFGMTLTSGAVSAFTSKRGHSQSLTLTAANVSSQTHTPGPVAPTSSCTRPLETWKEYIREWFPQLLHRTYFMPHIHINRTNPQTQIVFGVKIENPTSQVTSTGQKGEKQVLHESSVRDDMAQQHVLHCLNKLSEVLKEVMFVMSQFSYNNYLSHMCFSAAVRDLPRPLDLERQGLHRGDFDVLIINKKYGFVVGEIKSFGASDPAVNWTEDEFEQKLLDRLRDMMKLKKQNAVGQLMKAKRVLEHVNKDRKEKPKVTTTLILPNVSRSQLGRALGKDPVVQKALCKELGLAGGADPVEACLCSDQMSGPADPWHFDQHAVEQLVTWWQRCVGTSQDPAMSDAVYEDIVARFAGPASVVQAYATTESHVQMRTLGQAVAAVDEKLTDFALYPSQVDLLHQADDCVFLTGPPGTGKTLMLVLMAVGWLRGELGTESKNAEQDATPGVAELGGKPQHVHVVSTRKRSRAASHLILRQVTQTAERVIGLGVSSRVHLHCVDTMAHGAEAVKELAEAADEGRLNVIADEVEMESLSSFLSALRDQSAITKLRFWAASMMKLKEAVPGLKEFVLRNALRNPACVVREIEQAESIRKGQVYPFEKSAATLATSKVTESVGVDGGTIAHDSKTATRLMFDGPPVKKLKHVDGQDGHKGHFTVNCLQCGLNLAHVLLNDLHAGKKVKAIPSTGTPKKSSRASGAKPEMEPIHLLSTPIRFKDVFVLTFFDPAKDETDEKGQILRGLRQGGVPVRVIGESDDDDIAAVGSMKREDGDDDDDVVTMTGVNNVLGLERRVVVWVGAHDTGDDYGGRLTAISRCTGQLIWIYR